MSHVLVTGGAGFIGSHVVDSLLRDDYSVTVVDNFDSFYERSIKEESIADHRAHRRWRLVEADIRDGIELDRHIDQPVDAIVHLAARAGVRQRADSSSVASKLRSRAGTGCRGMVEGLSGFRAPSAPEGGRHRRVLRPERPRRRAW